KILPWTDNRVFPYTTLFRSPVTAARTDKTRGMTERARKATPVLTCRGIWETVRVVGRLTGVHRVVNGAGHAMAPDPRPDALPHRDRKSTRLNSSHVKISYAV